MGRVKKVACVNCGVPLKVLSPDSVHTVPSRIERFCEHSVKVDHQCEQCGSVNTVYWCNFTIPAWYA